MSDKGIILEVTVKKRPALLQSHESEPQEMQFPACTYNLHESWPIIGEEEEEARNKIERVSTEIGKIIKKEFPRAERES